MALQNAVGGQAATPTTPRQANQTSSQFNELERTVLENEQLINELEQRLNPIIRQDPAKPEMANNQAPPEEYLVPHADALRNLVKAACRTHFAIKSILNRVEI